MTQKNETGILALSLLITLGLIGGIYLWIAKSSNIKFIGATNNTTQQTNSQSSADSFAQVENVPSGLFRYGGSTTWAPIRKEVDSAIKTVLPKYQLNYTDPISGAPGSGTGIKMLLDNQLAFSQSSRSVKAEEYKLAEQKGFKLKEIPVAIDGIALAVNPKLNISGLTIAQIKDIYMGKITNWKDLGGNDLAIIPYSRRLEDGGTIEFFYENVLEKQNFGSNVQFIPTTTQALREVAKNAGGIYYASAPEVVPQCSVKSLPIGRKPGDFIPPYQEPGVSLAECPQKVNKLNFDAFQNNTYPITRSLFVIVKQNGQIDQQAGEKYADLLMTNQGQDLISKAGFVRIK